MTLPFKNDFDDVTQELIFVNTDEDYPNQVEKELGRDSITNSGWSLIDFLRMCPEHWDLRKKEECKFDTAFSVLSEHLPRLIELGYDSIGICVVSLVLNDEPSINVLRELKLIYDENWEGDTQH